MLDLEKNRELKKQNKIISLIPARAGSKGFPKKNIRLLAGYPLIAWSIIASKLSTKIERTIVSTDSQEFADIALFYGAEVPFLRPKEISKDDSLDIEYVKHALKWFQLHKGNQPEYLVILAPPTPLRDSKIIDEAIKKITQKPDATSLRSSYRSKESPCKHFQIKDGFYTGLCPEDTRPEYYNLPRQAFPPTYVPNGYVDIIKSHTISISGSLHGPRILPFITPEVGDIDQLQDFDFIEFLVIKRRSPIYEYLKENFPGGING